METAEELLRKFQALFVEKAPAAPISAGALATSNATQTARMVERIYGHQATVYGRRLQELLTGTYAWDLFTRARPRKSRLPRIHEISRCEPLLGIMRESGELARRERLLEERDAALVEIWRDESIDEIDRRAAAADVEARYASAVDAVSREYRPYYHRLRRATGVVPPLTGPRVRSRPLLQPPVLAHFFAACHAETDLAFEREGEWASIFRQGRHYVKLESGAADLLDEMTWDIAAIAVSAFFVRTSGSDPEASFPLLIDDYFDWRGVDPRKRSVQLRKQIDARLQLLFSDRLQIHSETDLWLVDPQSGRRKKTAIVSDGPFLVRRSGLYRLTAWVSEVENQPLYGYSVSLGSWASRYIEERAMIGVFPKTLAEYDLRRRQWERRIGWYLTFQMHNQGSRMKFEVVPGVEDDSTLVVTPQHPLRMRTVLAGGQVRWEEMARTNPGKVIKQWVDALDSLCRDGILGGYRCLDGAPDGSDLPPRNRLNAMLERRYEFVPGGEVLRHVRGKSDRRRQRKPAGGEA